jgi:hypothetical protein
VRDRENAALLAGPRNEIAGLRKVVRHRLVAHDVESRIERRGRVGIMRVIRCHDRDGVDAIGALLLPRQHLVHVAIAARRIEAHGGAADTRARRIAGEHARDGMPASVVSRRYAAVHSADPGIRPATDNASRSGRPTLVDPAMPPP